MRIEFTPSKNPRVIVVQKLYSKIYNNDQNLTFPNHRFKKLQALVNFVILENIGPFCGFFALARLGHLHFNGCNGGW